MWVVTRRALQRDEIRFQVLGPQIPIFQVMAHPADLWNVVHQLLLVLSRVRRVTDVTPVEGRRMNGSELCLLHDREVTCDAEFASALLGKFSKA